MRARTSSLVVSAALGEVRNLLFEVGVLGSERRRRGSLHLDLLLQPADLGSSSVIRSCIACTAPATRSIKSSTLSSSRLAESLLSLGKV